MRILHITASIKGGAGLAALRLHQALLKKGIDSTMVTLSGTHGYPKVIRIKEKRKSIIYRVLRRLRLNYLYDSLLKTDVFIEKILFKSNFEAFALSRDGTDLNEFLSQNNYDLVNLHWVARYINLEGLLNQLNAIPVVWTLHDMNPFTAGCTYSFDCQLFKTTGCNRCPQLKKTSFDFAAYNFKRKQKIISKHNFTIVSSSKQLQQNAQSSILLKQKEHKLIPLANFATKNVLADREKLKHDFGIAPNKLIVGFGAAGIERCNKGLFILIDVLKQLDIDKYQLLIFGPGNIDSFDTKEIDFIYYKEIQDPHMLSIIYTVMDVFVSLSKQEAFGQTFMEALCLGTPVIGTATGAILDYVTTNNGAILKSRDEQSLVTELTAFNSNNYNRQQIKDSARITFSPENMINAYIKLYKELIPD